MTAPLHRKYSQQGSMLLEALISILIFSIGILAIIGLQAASIKMSGDAKYRSDASLLANQLVGQMWADVASAVAAPSVCPANGFSANEFASYAGNYTPGTLTGNNNFDAWASSVLAALPNPSASAVVNTVLTPNPCAAGTQQSTATTATITIGWQLPGGDAHSFSTTALISAQKQF